MYRLLTFINPKSGEYDQIAPEIYNKHLYRLLDFPTKVFLKYLYLTILFILLSKSQQQRQKQTNNETVIILGRM